MVVVEVSVIKVVLMTNLPSKAIYMHTYMHTYTHACTIN